MCYPSYSEEEERRGQLQFERMATVVDQALAEASKQGQQDASPFFLGEFSIVDCIFVPYVERMNASLYYYKVRD